MREERLRSNPAQSWPIERNGMEKKPISGSAGMKLARNYSTGAPRLTSYGIATFVL